jgi:hypothetical protein
MVARHISASCQAHKRFSTPHPSSSFSPPPRSSKLGVAFHPSHHGEGLRSAQYLTKVRECSLTTFKRFDVLTAS